MSVFASETLMVTPRNDGGSNATDNFPNFVGYIATGIAVLFYGSNYVPVKKFDTGDGMFFQFFLCCGIWTVGMAVYAARSFPVFHPIVMLGGAIWTFGNLFAVPIIQSIGMGLGILIWGMFNMLTGWATGRFGLLGIPPQVPDSIAFNYAGVGLSAAASVIFFFVKPDVTAAGETQQEVQGEGGGGGWQSDQEGSISVYEDVFNGLDGGANSTRTLYPSLNRKNYSGRPEDEVVIVSGSAQQPPRTLNTQQSDVEQPQTVERPFWLTMTPARRRLFGVALAVMIGPMFGIGFVPTYYVQTHVSGASQNGLDYVFAHFTGIFIASLLFLIAYSVAKGNQPSVSRRLIVPAYISGVMWGVAGSSWFLANQVLSESISYPIISTAPAIVAAMWSVLVFREIRGLRNLILLCVAITMSAVGSVLNGLSKT